MGGTRCADPTNVYCTQQRHYVPGALAGNLQRTRNLLTDVSSTTTQYTAAQFPTAG